MFRWIGSTCIQDHQHHKPCQVRMLSIERLAPTLAYVCDTCSPRGAHQQLRVPSRKAAAATRSSSAAAVMVVGRPTCSDWASPAASPPDTRSYRENRYVCLHVAQHLLQHPQRLGTYYGKGSATSFRVVAASLKSLRLGREAASAHQ